MDNLAYMERLVELFGYETGELTQDFLQKVIDTVNDIQTEAFERGFEWGKLDNNIARSLEKLERGW